MKIEIAALDAKILLAFLRDTAIREIAIEHYAVPALGRLLTALDAAAREKSE